jgi:hypothetical protein
MANVLLTDQHIVSEALMILENDLTFTKFVDRQLDTEYRNAKRGATISVRKAPRYTVRDGQNVAVQDTTQTQIPFTLAHQFGVDVEFYSSDLALSISDFGRDILGPQIAAIANAIDWSGMQCALDVANAVGTPGTTPGSSGTAQQILKIFTDANAVLDKCAIPRDGRRNIVIQEDAQSAVVSGLSGLFQDSTEVSKQYREGTMGRTIGSKWSMDQNAAILTIGSAAGTPQVNGSGQALTSPPGSAGIGSAGFTRQTLAVKGFTASATVASHGDRFTLPTTYMVNPQNRQTSNTLQKFVVMNSTPVIADGSGNATLTIEPAIIVSGKDQTVSRAPLNNDALTFIGTSGTNSPQNLCFHETAFTFASAELPLPRGVHMAARKSDKRLGISMRFLADYIIASDQFLGRFDVLCGWLTQRPEAACVIYG